MGSLSIWHWMIVIVVVMLLFGGRGKLSNLMGDFAQGIKAFKKGMSEDDKRGARPSPSRPRPSRPPALRRRRTPSARRERALVNGAGGVAWGRAAALLLAHDLVRKPVPIPDQGRGQLFGIMRWS